MAKRNRSDIAAAKGLALINLGMAYFEYIEEPSLRHEAKRRFKLLIAHARQLVKELDRINGRQIQAINEDGTVSLKTIGDFTEQMADINFEFFLKAEAFFKEIGLEKMDEL